MYKENVNINVYVHKALSVLLHGKIDLPLVLEIKYGSYLLITHQ